MKTKNNKNRGFTLIELLVVISIIGLLSSVVLASLTATRDKAKLSKFAQEKHQADLFFELYYNEYGGYPYGAGSIYCVTSGATYTCALPGVGAIPEITTISNGTIGSVFDKVKGRINMLASVQVPRFKNDTTLKIGANDIRGIMYIPCTSPATINSIQVCVPTGTTSAGQSIIIYPGKSTSGGVAIKQSITGYSGNETNY